MVQLEAGGIGEIPWRSLISSGWVSLAHRCVQAGTHPAKKPNDGSCLWNLLQIGKLLTCPLQTWGTAPSPSCPSCPSYPHSSLFPVLRSGVLREGMEKRERSHGSSLLLLGLSFTDNWKPGLCFPDVNNAQIKWGCSGRKLCREALLAKDGSVFQTVGNLLSHDRLLNHWWFYPLVRLHPLFLQSMVLINCSGKHQSYLKRSIMAYYFFMQNGCLTRLPPWTSHMNRRANLIC